MTKKQELIDRAIRFGFVSKTLYNKAYKYSNLESLRYSLWMEELRKWFRDSGINIEINHRRFGVGSGDGYFYCRDISGGYIGRDLLNGFETYEECLEAALLAFITFQQEVLEK
jgi:hypothetical protein